MKVAALLGVIVITMLGLFVYASTVLAERSWPEPSGDPEGWHACNEQLIEQAPEPAACLSR